MGFLQGLYPPVGNTLGTQTLRNGMNVTAPMNGYQLIPVDLVTSGTGSEDSGWLQSTSNCAAAQISSNDYFASQEYLTTLNSTKDFYTMLEPVINGTFAANQTSFKNAYTIFDLINVAEIHNATINSSDLLTTEVLQQLRDLANAHEWGLAYNASSPTDMRSVAGKTLAAQIVQFLNGTLTSKGKSKIGIQFGAYASFLSFFGLADLPSVNTDFTGVVDYASAMTFELFTNSSTTVSSTSYPSADEVYVRFLFHNGTTNSSSEPVAYPLFGTGVDTIKWNDFTTAMNKFAIGNTEEWCTACGNSTGTCAAYATGASSSGSSSGSESEKSGNGLSPAVNGVIGAMVTLAVILGLEALVLAVGGLRVVSKKRVANHNGVGSGSDSEVAKA